MHPDDGPGRVFVLSEIVTSFWDMTNRQDWHVCALAQAGIGSASYQPGPYSNREDLLGTRSTDSLWRPLSADASIEGAEMPERGNPVNWFEIPVRDMARAAAFYEQVFGVTLVLNELGAIQMAWFPMSWASAAPRAR